MAVQIVKTMERTYSHSISSIPRMSSGMSPSSSNADIVLVLNQAVLTLRDLETSGLPPITSTTGIWAHSFSSPHRPCSVVHREALHQSHPCK